MPDPSKMQKFVDKINSTEPKKSYGFNPVITDNSVEQRLTPPINTPKANTQGIKESVNTWKSNQAKEKARWNALTSEQQQEEVDKQNQEIEAAKRRFDRDNLNKSYGGMEMTMAPHEYLFGVPIRGATAAATAAKTGFNLSKNVISKVPSVTNKLFTKGKNYVTGKIEETLAEGVLAETYNNFFGT